MIRVYAKSLYNIIRKLEVNRFIIKIQIKVESDKVICHVQQQIHITLGHISKNKSGSDNRAPFP